MNVKKSIKHLEDLTGAHRRVVIDNPLLTTLIFANPPAEICALHGTIPEGAGEDGMPEVNQRVISFINTDCLSLELRDQCRTYIREHSPEKKV